MENNTPFKPGQKVVCVETDPEKMTSSWEKHEIKKGNHYVVDESGWDDLFKFVYAKVKGMPIRWRASSFAPLPPSYENISSSLAKEALEGVGDKVDGPVREIIKQ